MSKPQLTAKNQEDLKAMMEHVDANAPTRYEVKGERGRWHVYVTKLFRYKARNRNKAVTYKKKAAAHKYVSEKINPKPKKEKKDGKTRNKAKMPS